MAEVISRRACAEVRAVCVCGQEIETDLAPDDFGVLISWSCEDCGSRITLFATLDLNVETHS